MPKANEQVSIKIESSAYELNAATITWTVDTKQISSGIGRKTFSFFTGKLGSQTHISILITPPGAEPFRKDLYFTPTDVALVWEAKTYTPPFYAGKALFSNQSTLSVTAIPDFITKDGRRLDPSTLIYKWKRNNKAQGSLSGYGIRTLTISGSTLGLPEKISVLVSSQDGTFMGEEAVTVTPTNPTVFLYENTPLYGVLYNKALGDSFAMGEKESSFSAVPYFFNRSSASDVLNFNWTVNNSPSGDKDSDIITLRNDEGAEGRSILGLEVANIGNTFQTARKSISVFFNTQ